MKIKIIDPIHAKDIIDELDDYLKSLYPDESNHLDSIETLQAENVRFCAAYDNSVIIAIGSVKLFESYAELKRIYVAPNHRGKGLAIQVIRELERIVQNNDLKILKLETGPYSKDAIQLYKKLGYSICGKFGSYHDDPLSTFMEKEL